jgi:ABC-type amino acid transport substrate-binding protein
MVLAMSPGVLLYGQTDTSITAISSGSELDYPPFCLVTADGRADGFSVELLRAALQAMGKQVTFEIGPWNRLKTDLSDGRLQVLPLVGRTPERETVFDFTFPYLSMHGAIFIREDDDRIRSLADLLDKEVVVMRGDNAEEYVRRHQVAGKVVTTKDFGRALDLVSTGQHDAVVIQKLVGLNLTRKLGISNLKAVAYPIRDFRQDFCFAVREGDKEMLSLLNEGLSVVVADGTLRRLQRKWLGPAESAASLHQRVRVIGGDASYPPYEFLDDRGQPTGYNVELTKAIAATMGLDIHIRLGQYAEICELLATGRIDAMQGMFYSQERDKVFDFSPPHTRIHYSALSRIGSPAVTSIEELHGLELIVMRGNIMHDLVLESQLTSSLTLARSEQEALDWLADGQGDYALVAELPGAYWQATRKDDLQSSKLLSTAYEYCYAVREGDADLLAALSEGLAVLEQEGIYRRIHDRWIGVYEQGSQEWRTVLVYSLWIIIPLLVIAIGTMLWSWSLRRQVASRTAALRDEIGKRGEAEKRLKVSLHDKEVLLRELHHRVKNNMQVICGLLSMQSAEIDDETVVAQLSDTQHRIRAMALVHEKLYQCEGLAEIDFKAYVDDLTKRLMSSCDLTRGGLRTRLVADPVSLSIEKAIPCGLILNELIGNCLKRACAMSPLLVAWDYGWFVTWRRSSCGEGLSCSIATRG